MSSRNPAADQLSSYAAQNRSSAILRTSNGAPVDSLTASMTVGSQGPILLQDFTLLDHMAHFDRERIPERVVHAKGAGAFGTFSVTDDFASKICKARVFQPGTVTPVAVRFSTVGGESGSADTARDPRGFAIKFYTTEGNWDLVGNNTPIFFLRDPILFPSFIHTQKRNPVTHLADPDMFWDFISLRPETLHQVSFLFSDRGTPNGYRHMNGYGSHTFKNVNAENQPVYVKYHFKTDQGISNLMADEAKRLAAEDPDYATRDLYNAIASGNYPSWTLYLQVMTFEQARSVSFNPFDLTKVWPHAQFPLHKVGQLVLNRNPTNYFAEVEQLAFSPSHMVPGIEPSPDKMLQARLFSYPDTHRHRLGVNYQNLPVNQSLHHQPPQHYQRDGSMTMTANAAPNYFPNSFQGPMPLSSAVWHSDGVVGDVQRLDTGHDDNVSQCREFYRHVLSEAERERLTDNMAHHLYKASPFIRQRVVDRLAEVDADYGAALERKVQRIVETAPAVAVVPPPAVAALSPPRTVSCPYGHASKL